MRNKVLSEHYKKVRFPGKSYGGGGAASSNFATTHSRQNRGIAELTNEQTPNQGSFQAVHLVKMLYLLHDIERAHCV